MQCKGLGFPSVFPPTGTHLSLGELRCHSIVPSLHGQRGCGEADTAACPLWGAQGLQHAPQGPPPAVPAIWGVGSLPGALPLIGMGAAAPADPGGAGESSAGPQHHHLHARVTTTAHSHHSTLGVGDGVEQFFNSGQLYLILF